MKWVDCCEKAVAECHNMGIETMKNGRRVADWNRNFRKADKLHNPNSHVRMGQKRTTPLFNIFPQLEARVREFITKHLDYFVVEILRGELINVIIPKLVQEAKADYEFETLGCDLFFDYTNHLPSYSTVLIWLHIMGYKHLAEGEVAEARELLVTYQAKLCSRFLSSTQTA